jgi:dTDP-4-dehydrorhamnose reductase
MNYRVALIGNTGLLGKDLEKVLVRAGHQVVGYRSSTLDIRDKHHVFKTLSGDGPFDCVINSAAYTKVDSCETHQSEAFELNSLGPKYLAQWCKANQTPLIHFSTDYVFDGTKDDPYIETDSPCPINVYGQSKLEGEQHIIQSGCDFYIFRIQWLFGDGPNFIRSILKKSAEVPELRVVNDQWGSPSWTYALAECVASVLEKRPPYGLYHLADGGYTTWYDLALYVLALANRPTPVLAIPSTELSLPAKRPLNSRLNTSKYLATGCLPPLEWQMAVKRFLTESGLL